MKSTDAVQRRYKNFVKLLVMLKSQQQKNRKQQNIIELINVDWYTLINRLKKLVDDLLKFKETNQQQNKISDMIWQICILET